MAKLSLKTLNAVTLHRDGQYVSVADEQISLIGGDLTGRRLVASGDSLHGYSVRPERRSLLRTPNGAVIPNAGCIPMLRFLASQQGIDLRVESSVAICRLPEPASIEHLHFPQMARFARQHERGLIRVDSDVAPELLVHDLAVAYPHQRIIVLGSHARQLDRIRDALAAHVPGVQSIRNGMPLLVDDDEDTPRLVCSTPLQASDADFATANIVILLDAYHCVQKRYQEALSQRDAKFRLFGIARANRKAAPSEVNGIAAVFGPDILELGSSGRSRRNANIAWLTSPSPRVNLEPKDSEFWWQCYGHNERRNRLVKQLAVALSAGDNLDHRNFGEVPTWLDNRGSRPQSVTILVDRLAHAIALAKQLPDWTVFTGNISIKNCPGSFRNRVKRQSHHWLTGQRQIVLAAAADQFRGETSDVVIWAGGGQYIDAIPQDWLMAMENASKPLLIVDFDDVHNETARAWSRERKRAYYDRDIFPLGISVGQGRIIMFLDRQQAEDEQ